MVPGSERGTRIDGLRLRSCTVHSDERGQFFETFERDRTSTAAHASYESFIRHGYEV